MSRGGIPPPPLFPLGVGDRVLPKNFKNYTSRRRRRRRSQGHAVGPHKALPQVETRRRLFSRLLRRVAGSQADCPTPPRPACVCVSARRASCLRFRGTSARSRCFGGEVSKAAQHCALPKYMPARARAAEPGGGGASGCVPITKARQSMCSACLGFSRHTLVIGQRSASLRGAAAAQECGAASPPREQGDPGSSLARSRR